MSASTENTGSSSRRVRSIIIGLRLTALLVTIVVVPTFWRVMIWLPWQVDCLIAAAAALAFAYTFEREKSR